MELVQAAVNLSDGGLVLYGGVVVGTLGFIVYCLRRKLSMLLVGDIAMPSIFIGLAFGRFGCFLNGCCYGDRCTLPWAVRFPADSVPFRALVVRGFLDPAASASPPLHPTQLYSVINAIILAAITAVYFRYRPRNGAVLAVGFIIYPITRIIIELLRGDELGQFGTGLTISQIFSIVLSVASMAYLAYLLLTRPAAPDAPAQS
jgi:phosphatidylglycerol:prolipoprotein diacylglycerol transferase